MIMRDLDFLNPYAIFVSLALVVLTCFWIYFFIYRKKTLENLIPKSFQDSLISQQPSYVYWGRAILVTIVWIFAVVALMGPFGLGEYQVEEESTVRTTEEVIFLLDVSASMAVTDARYGKDRLQSAKDIIDDLAAALTGQNASLYYFTSHAYRSVPATLDYLFLRLMNGHLQINEAETTGTDLVLTLRKLIEELKRKPLSTVKTVVLITDGGDADYETLDGDAKENRKAEILKLASELANWNAYLIVVGMGSVAGGTVPNIEDQGKTVHAVLQQKLLQEVAAAAHGIYFASNDQPHADLEAKIVPRIIYAVPTIAASQIESKTQLIPKLYFQVPLGIALLLLIFVL